MAELTAFSYRVQDSFLHRLDTRFKLLFLILLSITGLKAGFPQLFLPSAVILFLLAHIKQDIRILWKDLRYFFLFMMFIVLTRSVSLSGTSLFEFGLIIISQEGIWDGVLISWRLLLVVLLSLLFMSTTRPSDVRSAVAWSLDPLPWIPGKRIALMLSLVIRFVPMVFETAGEVGAAQRARGVENRKNPVYRLVKFVIPVSYRVFQNADNLATAMEARGYSDLRTSPALRCTKRDWAALVGVLCLCILLVWW